MNISQRLRTCAKHTGLDAVIELLQEAADEIDALQARAILALRPERVPMTDTQLCEALNIDGSDDWTYQVRDAVEAHHRIPAQAKKEAS